MDSDLVPIGNIGPATARALTAAGVADAASLRRIGAHEAYRALLVAGGRPHFIGYYVMHMALQGRPWNDCKGKEKDDLRITFDAICAEFKGSKASHKSEFEKVLNEIGVLPANPA